MDMMRQPRPSIVQLNALLDVFELHPDLARGNPKGRDSRRRSAALWRQICSRLNSLEGCKKSYKQWQKFWRDKKLTVRRRIADQAEVDTDSCRVLNPTELRISHLLEMTAMEQDDDGNMKAGDMQYKGPRSVSEDMEDENALEEEPIDCDFVGVYQVKNDPGSPKNPGRKSRALGNSSHKRPRGPLTSAKLIPWIVQIEERRANNEEKTTNALLDIAECLKRQEDLMQKLSNILLQIVPKIMADS